GKSIIVMFQVTVNANDTATQVCNQGTVTADGGISVQTDDPNVSGSANPTCTTVFVPAMITPSLANQQVAKGTTPPFTTTLKGNVPFVPVWKKNGTVITSGVSLGGRATINTSSNTTSTTTTLTITGTLLTDSDTYTVDATDACSKPATQQSATLTVVAP